MFFYLFNVDKTLRVYWCSPLLNVCYSKDIFHRRGGAVESPLDS